MRRNRLSIASGWGLLDWRRRRFHSRTVAETALYEAYLLHWLVFDVIEQLLWRPCLNDRRQKSMLNSMEPVKGMFEGDFRR